MSNLRAPWQNSPYISNTQNSTKTHRTLRRKRHLEKLVLVFFGFCYFFLFIPYFTLIRTKQIHRSINYQYKQILRSILFYMWLSFRLYWSVIKGQLPSICGLELLKATCSSVGTSLFLRSHDCVTVLHYLTSILMEKYRVWQFILFDNLTEFRSSSNTIVCWYDKYLLFKKCFCHLF